MSYKYDFSGGGAGGYDYASMVKNIFGKQGGMGGGAGGGFMFSSPTGGLSTGDKQNKILAMHDNSQLGGIPTIDAVGAGELRASIRNAPYESAERIASMNNAAEMSQAQMQARMQMAQMMIQAQIAAEQRKNDIELQRRNALQSQYEQKNKAYYDYGIS